MTYMYKSYGRNFLVSEVTAFYTNTNPVFTITDKRQYKIILVILQC